MTITTMPLGMLQTNCYILSQGDRCLVIDPGDEAQKVLAFLDILIMWVPSHPWHPKPTVGYSSAKRIWHCPGP